MSLHSAARSCRALFGPFAVARCNPSTRHLLFQPSFLLRPSPCVHRFFASVPSASTSAAAPSSPDSASSVSPGYASIHSKLTSALQPTFLHLEDTSGGCGTFYRLVIAAPAFEGLSLVAQHRRVKEAIKEDIAAIHGLTIDTMTETQLRERKAAQAQRRS